MADMKYLNTRVQLKYDSYENWSKAENQKDLLPGEIAIAYLGPTHTTTTPDNGTHPVLFKVGPGKFNALPWASALAADVYDWAKLSENDFVNTFLSLKMTDGTTVQDKLDAVFATDAIVGDLSKLSTTVKTDLVNAINEVRQAVEVGGTGSVVTVTKEATPTTGSAATYTIKQGDNAVAGDKIEIPEAPTGFKIAHNIEVDEVIEVTAPEASSIGENEINLSFAHAFKGPRNDEGNPVGANVGSTVGLQIDEEHKKITFNVPYLEVDGHGHVNQASAAQFDIDLEQYATLSNIGNGVLTLKAGSNTKTFSANSADSVEFEIKASDLGLASAMHFIGVYDEEPLTRDNGDVLIAGDVYLNEITHKEYVFDGAVWIELGDEGSHALKTISITGTDGLTGGGTLESNREIKLSDATKASLALADSSKQKQTAVDNKFTAPAHVLSSLSQNENGDIAYEVKELTPADIGAPTVKEMSDQGVAILAEAQKYADSLNHEDTKYAAAADGGLKLNENNEFAIDDSVTFVFRCGSATELI